MSAWTEDRITRLRRLWAQGRSATWIAADLGGGLTRNAVLAKVWRMGLSEGRAAAGALPRRRMTSPPPPLESLPLSPERGRVSILTVRRSDCRWPYGDPLLPGFSLCGCRVSRGAYCASHAAVAYRGAPANIEGLLRGAGVA